MTRTRFLAATAVLTLIAAPAFAQGMMKNEMSSPGMAKEDGMSKDAMSSGRSVTVGGAPMYPTKNIIENAVNSKDHTTLVAAVKAAGLVETLEGKGPFTVFAPTNEAFAKLPAGTVDTLVKPENKKTLTGILTYHVVAGAHSAADDQGRHRKGRRQGGMEDGQRRDADGLDDGERHARPHRREGRQGPCHDRRRQPVERRHPCHRHRADAGLIPSSFPAGTRRGPLCGPLCVSHPAGRAR